MEGNGGRRTSTCGVTEVTGVREVLPRVAVIPTYLTVLINKRAADVHMQSRFPPERRGERESTCRKGVTSVTAQVGRGARALLSPATATPPAATPSCTTHEIHSPGRNAMNEIVAVGGVWRDGRSPARLCIAHSSKTGLPCKRPPIQGAKVCRTHGGAAPHVKAAAKVRLENAALNLAKELLGMAMADDLPPAVKLAALKDALDRAGLTPKQALDVSVELKPYERLLQHVERGPRPGREAQPSLALDDVIEAEVVHEEGEGAHACRGCGLDFSPWPEPDGGYPSLCLECREARPLPSRRWCSRRPTAAPAPPPRAPTRATRAWWPATPSTGCCPGRTPPPRPPAARRDHAVVAAHGPEWTLKVDLAGVRFAARRRVYPDRSGDAGRSLTPRRRTPCPP